MGGIDYDAIGITKEDIDGLSCYQKSFFNVVKGATLTRSTAGFSEEVFYPEIEGKRQTSILTAVRAGHSTATIFDISRTRSAKWGGDMIV